jgi:hypothetical protein
LAIANEFHEEILRLKVGLKVAGEKLFEHG